MQLRQWLSTGARGERLAARWLRRRGYRILHRNLRVGRDEADLIALDPRGRAVVIVEVKTRRGAGRSPEMRVDVHKRRRMLRLAGRLRRRRDFERYGIRFDVVAIDWPRGARPTIRHYVSMLEPPW